MSGDYLLRSSTLTAVLLLADEQERYIREARARLVSTGFTESTAVATVADIIRLARQSPRPTAEVLDAWLDDMVRQVAPVAGSDVPTLVMEACDAAPVPDLPNAITHDYPRNRAEARAQRFGHAPKDHYAHRR